MTQRVTLIRDLGIIVDTKLQFTDQINHVINRANKQLGFIMRHSKDFKNKETLRLLYLTLVRSTLTYNSVVWHPLRKESMLRLERVQHKFFRFASSVLKIKRKEFDHAMITLILQNFLICLQ